MDTESEGCFHGISDGKTFAQTSYQHNYLELF